MITTYDRGQGIVAGMRTDGPTRQLFFPITPDILDLLEKDGASAFAVPRTYMEVSVEEYLGLLPDVEGEIVYLLTVLHKAQKDVSKLLGMPQQTISYRFRRAIDKLSYLMLLSAIDLQPLINEVPLLRDVERKVLYALFYTANQERAGEKYGVQQSSVKWTFMKAKRYLEALERKEPVVWGPHYTLFLLLEKNLRKRIFA